MPAVVNGHSLAYDVGSKMQLPMSMPDEQLLGHTDYMEACLRMGIDVQ